MTTTNKDGKPQKDPSEIVMATVTYKDGRTEEITGARFFELLSHYAKGTTQPDHLDGNPNAKEELEVLAQMLRFAIDFRLTPENAPQEWDSEGKM